MPYKENEIVDYLAGNGYELGGVVREGESKVQLKDKFLNTIRVAPKQILCSYGVATGDLRRELTDLNAKIDATKTEVDCEFLWEIASETPGEKNFGDISESYFGDREPLHISVLARVLPEDVIHFQRVVGIAGVVKVRTAEEAEDMRRLKQLRAEKAARRDRAAAWLAEALGHKGTEPFQIPDELEGFVKNIADYLLCGTNSDAVTLLANAAGRNPIRECALSVLKAVHRVPEGADEFLLANGIHAGFSTAVLEAAEALPDDFNREGRSLVKNELIFSIDDEETREIDDAISCRREGEDYLVGVYIADPACYVNKDDVLDEAAADRPLSLYLPTTMVKMFPERLSCDLASLKQGVERPCLAFNLRLNKEGEILDWSISPAIVAVNRRLTYIEADDILENEQSELSIALNDLLMLADAMRKAREADGAVVLNRPEVRVRVQGDDVRVWLENQNTPTHRLVAEFMVQVNYAAAKYALHNEIPVIYRVQEPPSAPVCSVHEYEPFFFDQQVRRMKRTRLSTYPQPHFGLGLDLYIQVSSPLRRYADLVLHRQIQAHCLGNPCPYTQEELFAILDKVDSTSSRNRALENQADNRWILEYLRRNFIGKPTGATALRVEGSLVLAELDTYCVRGIVLSRDKPRPGEHISVSIKEVHPDSARLVMQRL